MTDTHRDKRLSDASSLQKSLGSLHKVAHADRQEFFHDRIMSAIDDVCARHKGTKSTSVFSSAQILVLKDVVFQVVYILEPTNKIPSDFIAKLKAEWSETSAFKQVSIAVAALTLAWTVAVGGYHTGKIVFHYLSGISVAFKEPEPDAPAASNPSTPTKPAH